MGHVIHGYLGYDAVTVQKLPNTASLIKEMPGKSSFVNDGFIKQFYSHEILSSIPIIMHFSTAVTSKLK